MFGVGVAGAVPAAYPKTVAASTVWNTFNPTVGGRRSYPSASTFASPSFTDSPGWTWPANGPLSVPGYTVQMQLHTDRLEEVIASQPDHHYGLAIAGVEKLTNTSQNVGTDILGPMTNMPTVSGTLNFHDYTGHGGGTAFVGVVTVLYQYTRA